MILLIPVRRARKQSRTESHWSQQREGTLGASQIGDQGRGNAQRESEFCSVLGRGNPPLEID